MIVGCIIVYQEAQLIHRAIKSLVPYCKRIIVVDGAYKDYPRFTDEFRSTDGTIEIAKQAGAEVIEAAEAWKDQVTKRNTYIHAVNNGDIIIHIDADERWVGKPWMRGNYPGYQVPVVEVPGKRYNHWIRVFVKTPGLHYKGAHNILYDGNNMLKPEHCPIMEGARVDHCSYMRSNNRLSVNDQYYLIQYDAEREFRLAHDCP